MEAITQACYKECVRTLMLSHTCCLKTISVNKAHLCLREVSACGHLCACTHVSVRTQASHSFPLPPAALVRKKRHIAQPPAGGWDLVCSEASLGDSWGLRSCPIPRSFSCNSVLPLCLPAGAPTRPVTLRLRQVPAAKDRFQGGVHPLEAMGSLKPNMVSSYDLLTSKLS